MFLKKERDKEIFSREHLFKRPIEEQKTETYMFEV